MSGLGAGEPKAARGTKGFASLPWNLAMRSRTPPLDDPPEGIRDGLSPGLMRPDELLWAEPGDRPPDLDGTGLDVLR